MTMILNTHLRPLLISEEEQGESDSVAKYVSCSEPNRTPMGNSEATSLSITLIQTPISKRGQFLRMEKIDRQNVANLFIPCLEDLVLSLKIMEAIQSTRFSRLPSETA